jgi:hypothetical protein
MGRPPGHQIRKRCLKNGTAATGNLDRGTRGVDARLHTLVCRAQLLSCPILFFNIIPISIPEIEKQTSESEFLSQIRAYNASEYDGLTEFDEEKESPSDCSGAQTDFDQLITDLEETYEGFVQELNDLTK